MLERKRRLFHFFSFFSNLLKAQNGSGEGEGTTFSYLGNKVDGRTGRGVEAKRRKKYFGLLFNLNT